MRQRGSRADLVAVSANILSPIAKNAKLQPAPWRFPPVHSPGSAGGSPASWSQEMAKFARHHETRSTQKKTPASSKTAATKSPVSGADAEAVKKIPVGATNAMAAKVDQSPAGKKGSSSIPNLEGSNCPKRGTLEEMEKRADNLLKRRVTLRSLTSTSETVLVPRIARPKIRSFFPRHRSRTKRGATGEERPTH